MAGSMRRVYIGVVETGTPGAFECAVAENQAYVIQWLMQDISSRHDFPPDQLAQVRELLRNIAKEDPTADEFRTEHACYKIQRRYLMDDLIDVY